MGDIDTAESPVLILGRVRKDDDVGSANQILDGKMLVGDDEMPSFPLPAPMTFLVPSRTTCTLTISRTSYSSS